MDEVVKLPDTELIRKKSDEIIVNANSVIISNDVQYRAAGEFLKSIVAVKKEIIDTFSDPKEKAFEAHKAIVAAEKKHKDPLDTAERIIKGKMSTYQVEQERKAREERARLEAEQKQKEEESRLREAENLEAAGKKEEAEAVIDEPLPAFNIPVVKTEKITGISFRDNWQFEIFDEKLIPREYLTPDEKKIGGVVRALKNETNIPGVKVFNNKVVNTRA